MSVAPLAAPTVTDAPEAASSDPVVPAVSARVLVAMGGIPLYGQERGNIAVFEAVQDAGVDALFVTNAAYGHERIQPELDRLGLRWTTGAYPGFWSLRGGPRAWVRQVREVVRGNGDFLRAARAYRPTHVHMMNERYFLNLLPAVWRLGVPVVYRLGDVPRQHRWLFRFVWSRLLIPSVSEFVCISEFVRERLIEAGAPPERTRVIRNAPPDHARVGDAAVEQGLSPDVRMVSYIGRITEAKGAGLFVEAAMALCAERDDVEFRLAGDYAWQNPFAQRLIEEVRAAGLAERIRFLGFIDDVDGLLAETDVLCVPSLCEEALGNVVQEAKRAGVPSVVFPSGGLPELIAEPGVDGVVCPESTPGALMRGVVHYLDMDPVRRDRSRAAARSSLKTLGLTASTFRAAWASVFASAPPPRQTSTP